MPSTRTTIIVLKHQSYIEFAFKSTIDISFLFHFIANIFHPFFLKKKEKKYVLSYSRWREFVNSSFDTTHKSEIEILLESKRRTIGCTCLLNVVLSVMRQSFQLVSCRFKGETSNYMVHQIPRSKGGGSRVRVGYTSAKHAIGLNFKIDRRLRTEIASISIMNGGRVRARVCVCTTQTKYVL